MGQLPRRAERVNRASREFKGIDIAAVRYIDPETRHALMCSINGIATALGSTFKPFTNPQDLYVKVVGSSSLKEQVGIKSHRQIMVDTARLEIAEETILESGVEPTIDLRVNWDEPLILDRKNDRLLVNLKDTDRNYSLDRARAFAAIQRHTKKRDTKSATPITNQSLPTIAIGRVNRYMLGAQQYMFERDPGQFIADAMYDARSSEDAVAGIYVPPVAPDLFTFGALHVVALRRKPEEFHQSDYAGYIEGCEFEGLKLIRRTELDINQPGGQSAEI